jgi:hypothetical protein
VVSIPDVEHWNVAALQQVFSVSQNAGMSLQKLGEGLDGTAAGLTDWMGPASEAWRLEHGKLRTDVMDQHGQTQAVGRIVTTAIDDVQWCINELKDARAPAEALGMKVNSDGSVTDPNAGKSSDQQEADHREQVRSTAEARLKHLLSVAGTTETEVANGLRAAVGDPAAAIPADAPRPTQSATKPAAAGQSTKPGEKPPGPTDPLGQLLGVGDPASSKPDPNSPWTKQAPPAQPDKPPANPLDLLAGKDGEGDGTTEHPRSLQEMMLPGGPPAPSVQAPRPKLDPNSPEGKAAIANLRQVMINDKVPPAEIDQRINAMLAAPLDPNAPHAPVERPSPPKPSYSDGFRDAWNSTGDAVHALTGQDGFDKFKDAWKNLGESVNSAVTDPVGTGARTVHEEYEAFKANPEYWAGQKGFDAAAGAATLPFGGGEGALARGALDSAAVHGVEHGIEHGAVPGAAGTLAHDPPPVAPHAPADLPPTSGHGAIGHSGDGGSAHPGDLNQVHAEPGSKGAWNYDLNNPQPDTLYNVGDRFTYTTDDLSRSTDAHGSLNLGDPAERNGYQQGIAGGADRLPDDHGGHIFGSQFGGPGEAINITAMNDKLNLMGYAGLENEWKSLLQQGHSVDAYVNIQYPGDSMRPSRYAIDTYVDGKLVGTRYFDNN